MPPAERWAVLPSAPPRPWPPRLLRASPAERGRFALSPAPWSGVLVAVSAVGGAWSPVFRFECCKDGVANRPLNSRREGAVSAAGRTAPRDAPAGSGGPARHGSAGTARRGSFPCLPFLSSVIELYGAVTMNKARMSSIPFFEFNNFYFFNCCRKTIC